MTIFVDALVAWPQKTTGQAARHFGNGKQSCHMWTDGDVEELNAFAESIGLRRAWLQTKHAYFLHYDLTPARRAAAVRKGAQEVRLLDWLRTKRAGPAPEQARMEL